MTSEEIVKVKIEALQELLDSDNGVFTMYAWSSNEDYIKYMSNNEGSQTSYVQAVEDYITWYIGRLKDSIQR